MKPLNDITSNTNILRSNQMKATPVRLAVLDLFNNSNSPLSIKDVTEKLKKEKLDIVTTYRTINSLVKKNILRQVEMQHNHAHYELSKNHHHHLICKQCGKVIDIENCNFNSIKKQALLLSGFAEIVEHSFELFGICKPCSNKLSANKIKKAR